MRKAWVVLLSFTVFAGVPRPAAAWGFEAHKYITTRVIALLPQEIRPYFEKYQAGIVEHSIDPDLWRTAGWLDEPPRHFVDMDSYGPYPFTGLPHLYDDAVRRYGADFVIKNGTLPWRAEEIYGKLVEAFTQKAPYSRENIQFFSSVLAHYCADAHVPFHATLNHDGQLTGQSGIHSRFESELFERYQSRLAVTPRPIAPVANARESIFDALAASFAAVQPVLDADKAAIAGRDTYDDAYFTGFFAKAGPVLEKRLADSITDAASLISAAWVAAGRPPLPLESTRPPRKVRREG
jgi:hypothetical protein